MSDRSSCLNGNGNGIIQNNAVPATIAGVASEVHEEILAWMHLASAGFLNGSYTMTAGDALFNDNNNPKNPYNIYLQLIYDNNYADTAVGRRRRSTT